MERNKNLNVFLEQFLLLNRKIELLGKLNLNNEALHAEYFFMNLFNLMFDLSLKNANLENSNSEAIDLIDIDKKK